MKILSRPYVPFELTVPWVLMAGFLYYCRDYSLMPDTEFDKLCRSLLLRWDDVTHRHKRLLSKTMLEAGSLYALKEEDYPAMTRVAALHLREICQRTGKPANSFLGKGEDATATPSGAIQEICVSLKLKPRVTKLKVKA